MRVPASRLSRAAALLALLAVPAGAAEYWVNSGGSDGADGLTQATAWATLGHAADSDPTGSHAGIRGVVVRDRSAQQDGLVRFGVKGNGGSITLPSPSATRAAVVLGAANECAAVVFNPPGGVRPRCRGDAARIVCR